MDTRGLRIITGYRCNYECKFCYQRKKTNRFSTLSEFRAALQRLPHDYAPEYITIIGGEPTIDKALFHKIHTLVQRFPNTSVSVTTNGSGRQYDGNYHKAEAYYQRLLGVAPNVHLTFSLPSINPMDYDVIIGRDRNVSDYVRMINNLHQHYGNHACRLNVYMDIQNTHRWKNVVLYAASHNLTTTLCTELTAETDYLLLIPKAWTVSPLAENTKLITLPTGYTFWLYHHKNDYANDNVILLPNGVVTDSFNDVIEGKGVIEHSKRIPFYNIEMVKCSGRGCANEFPVPAIKNIHEIPIELYSNGWHTFWGEFSNGWLCPSCYPKYY